VNAAIPEEASVLREDDRATLRRLLGERVRFDEVLAPYTSWKIGGPADALLDVHAPEELAAVLALARTRRLPWFTFGSGSNLLVGDGGIRGLVVRLGGAFAELAFADDGPGRIVVRAGASVAVSLLVAQAASRGALGVWSLAGVPGTVGGSLRMNAGTDREIGEFAREVRAQTPGRPQPHVVAPQYFYRRTTLDRDAIVTFVTLAFEAGDPAEVRRETQARLVRRKSTQPLRYPNAGSCFRNPPGESAGRLIEASGAKGMRIGDAEVSEMHANFVVNRGAATASEVAQLLARVRRGVLERFAVELELEIHFVGAFT